MPKKKKAKPAPDNTYRDAETMPVKPWVRWVALLIVAILGVSVIAGAITPGLQ